MVGLTLAAAAALALSALAAFLLSKWRRHCAEVEIHREISALRRNSAELYKPWTQENETVVRHEERFARIDHAFQALANANALSVPTVNEKPAARMPNEALDTVLGTGSSRTTAIHAKRIPQKPDPPEVWIDHTKRDARGNALCWHFYEFAEVPVVLEMTTSVRVARKRDRPCEVDIFICLSFASFDDLGELHPSARETLPTWKVVKTIRCDLREAEYRAVVEAKGWALAALRREVLVGDGTDPTTEYRDAVKYRGYHESGWRQNSEKMKVLEAKLVSLDSTELSLHPISLWHRFAQPILHRVRARRQRDR